ncbi:MAG: 2-keto-4-pentenoate hydratase, partial [Caulobacter sp. 35-67-4]
FKKNLWEAGAAPTPFRAIEGGFTAVEAEFIIRLGKDAPEGKTQWTAEEAAEYVGELILGVEIAGSPLKTINVLGPPIVASDFGNNDGQILGPVLENWRDIAWEDMAVETTINGVVVGKGTAASIPGSPLAALAFLLGHVASRGRPLKKEMLVTTGASTGIHDVVAGDAATVSFGALGQVECVAVPAK